MWVESGKDNRSVESGEGRPVTGGGVRRQEVESGKDKRWVETRVY